MFRPPMLRWSSGIPTEMTCRTPARFATWANSRYGVSLSWVSTTMVCPDLAASRHGPNPILYCRSSRSTAKAPVNTTLCARPFSTTVMDTSFTPPNVSFGQLGDPAKRLVGRLGVHHDPGELGEGVERLRTATGGEGWGDVVHDGPHAHAGHAHFGLVSLIPGPSRDPSLREHTS